MILIFSVIIIFLIIFALNYGFIAMFKLKSRQNILESEGLPRNIRFTACPNNNSNAKSNSRPLAVIFSWLNAKDKSLDKFRELWFEKGFDVLTVRTTIFEAMIPPIGSQIIARNLVKVLSDLNSEYNEIVIHAFSIGGYQFGEVLVQLMADKKYENIVNSLKGFIMDSIVFSKDRSGGMSRTITKNQMLHPILETIFDILFFLMHNVIVKHYKASEEMVVNPPINYPGLIFYSKDDLMSIFGSNEDLVKKWIKKGNDIRVKCWDESAHILHYKNNGQEYKQELDAFIEALKLTNNQTSTY